MAEDRGASFDEMVAGLTFPTGDEQALDAQLVEGRVVLTVSPGVADLVRAVTCASADAAAAALAVEECRRSIDEPLSPMEVIDRRHLSAARAATDLFALARTAPVVLGHVETTHLCSTLHRGVAEVEAGLPLGFDLDGPQRNVVAGLVSVVAAVLAEAVSD